MKPLKRWNGRMPALRPLALVLAATFLAGPGARGASPFPSVGPVRPSTPTDAVTSCDDAGPGSLRNALATDTSEIDLTTLPCSTITLTTGALVSSAPNVTLHGPGADRLAIDGNGASGVLVHAAGDSAALTLRGLTLRNGLGADRGGCVYASGYVTLVDASVESCTVYGHYQARGGGLFVGRGLSMQRSRIADCHATTAAGYAAFGGGVYVRGHTDNEYAGIRESTLERNSADGGGGGGLAALGITLIYNSTFSDNHADNGGAGGAITMLGYPGLGAIIVASTISGNTAGRGGGVFAGEPLSLREVTVAFNAADAGGGMYLRDTTHAVALFGTLVADNLQGGIANDIAGHAGTSLAGDHNLIFASSLTPPPDTIVGIDPELAPLADNGGPTKTHALLAGSAAIDVGALDVVPAFAHYDQREHGAARMAGAAPDIGAYEVQSTGVTHVVSNCADAGAGSLRELIATAESGDTISFGDLVCGTVTLTSGALGVAQGNLAIVGPDARALAIDGGQLDRVIDHEGLGTLRLSGVTLQDGWELAGSGYSAGGCVHSASTLILDDVTLASCQVYTTDRPALGGGGAAMRMLATRAIVVGNSLNGVFQGRGGGLFAYDYLSLRDSVVSNNIGAYSGGGVSAGTAVIEGTTIDGNHAYIGGGLYAGSARITNSTISGNTAAAVAGLSVLSAFSLSNSTVAFNTATGSTLRSAGVLTGARFDLESSIVFGNTTLGSPYDIGDLPPIFRAVVFGANNLVGFSGVELPPDTLSDDPLLGPLQDNGGSTSTHALLDGSPAIDTGNNSAALAFDQRGTGFARVNGTATDIGAFETGAVIDSIFADGFD